MAVLALTACPFRPGRRPPSLPWPNFTRLACDVAQEPPAKGVAFVPAPSAVPVAALPSSGEFGKVTFTASTATHYRVQVWAARGSSSRRLVARFLGDGRIFGSFFLRVRGEETLEASFERCDAGTWREERPGTSSAVADLDGVRWSIVGQGATVTVFYGPMVRREVEEDAARRFAPVVRLHPNEVYAPANVHWYLSRVRMRHHRSVLRWCSLLFFICPPVRLDAQLLDLGQVNAASLLAQRSGGQTSGVGSKRTDFFLEIDGSEQSQNETRRGSLESAVVYAHIRQAPSGSAKFDIQFWFFYPFNGSIVTAPVYRPQHEGDWEHITVRVSPDFQVADSVFFAAHSGSDAWLPASAVSWDGSHPIVYSALGSHASYPTAGTQSRPPWVLMPDDHTSDGGHVWHTWQRVSVVGSFDNPTPGNEWIRYTGRWGQMGVAFIGGKTATDGPRGPAFQGWWYDDNKGR